MGNQLHLLTENKLLHENKFLIVLLYLVNLYLVYFSKITLFPL